MQYIPRRLAANTGETVNATGRFIWLKAATGAVFIKTDRGETARLSAGDFVRMDRPFTEFRVDDLSGAQNDLMFNIADEGEAGKYGNVNIATPNVLNDIADVVHNTIGAHLILPANANRNEAIITSDPASTNTVRIGGANVAANRGTPLVAGATVFLNTTAPIYIYNPAATAVTFNVGFTEFN